jgi:hypothetical protein
MEIKGKIKLLKLDQRVSEKYTKSEMVLVTDEQYPQSILIEFGGKNSDLPNGYKVGESVTVGINLRGREWTSPQGEVKYFNSIQGWKINRDVANIHVTDAKIVSPQPFKEGEKDDLPF